MYLQKKLLDLDVTSFEKMYLIPKWIPYNNEIVNLEFFKWLRNYDEEDHKKMILHLLSCLGEKRI